MPYITKERKWDYANAQRLWPEWKPDNAGELNFQFTMIIKEYITRKGFKYQHMNDVLGALVGAALEFYRQVVRHYEDVKKIENGDVYNLVYDTEKKEFYFKEDKPNG